MHLAAGSRSTFPLTNAFHAGFSFSSSSFHTLPLFVSDFHLNPHPVSGICFRETKLRSDCPSSSATIQSLPLPCTSQRQKFIEAGFFFFFSFPLPVLPIPAVLVFLAQLIGSELRYSGTFSKTLSSDQLDPLLSVQSLSDHCVIRLGFGAG